MMETSLATTADKKFGFFSGEQRGRLLLVVVHSRSTYPWFLDLLGGGKDFSRTTRQTKKGLRL